MEWTDGIEPMNRYELMQYQAYRDLEKRVFEEKKRQEELKYGKFSIGKYLLRRDERWKPDNWEVLSRKEVRALKRSYFLTFSDIFEIVYHFIDLPLFSWLKSIHLAATIPLDRFLPRALMPLICTIIAYASIGDIDRIFDCTRDVFSALFLAIVVVTFLSAFVSLILNTIPKLRTIRKIDYSIGENEGKDKYGRKLGYMLTPLSKFGVNTNDLARSRYELKESKMNFRDDAEENKDIKKVLGNYIHRVSEEAAEVSKEYGKSLEVDYSKSVFGDRWNEIKAPAWETAWETDIHTKRKSLNEVFYEIEHMDELTDEYYRKLEEEAEPELPRPKVVSSEGILSDIADISKADAADAEIIVEEKDLQ